jgi:hypothetical protein
MATATAVSVLKADSLLIVEDPAGTGRLIRNQARGMPLFVTKSYFPD